MSAPFRHNSSAVDLVINGYPLGWRHMGTGVYTRRLIQGLLAHAPHLRFCVLLPESMAENAADLPPENVHLLTGRPPINRSIAKDIYWNNRVGAEAATRYPNAVFHAPREFWSLAQPRHTVVTVHDCTWRFFPQLQGGLVRRWWWRATERCARGAQLVLTDSIASKNDLVSLARIPASKVKVLYPWLDVADFRERARRDRETVRAKFHLPSRFFLYFGGFNVNKNVPFLVRAYADAARQASLPPLVIAGYINDDLRLAVSDVRGAIREAGLPAGQIVTPGYIHEDDVPGLLAAADLLVYPSIYEGFGYPPVEAMAAETAVLVADTTSLPEVVRPVQCRFSLRDSLDLSERLARASIDTAQYRAEVPAEFAEERGVARYLDLLGFKATPTFVHVHG